MSLFFSWIFSYPVGLGTALLLPKEATEILHVFWVYAKHLPFSSNSTHSEQPWQISLNALPTSPLHTHTVHKQTHVQNSLSLLSTHTHFPPSFSSWLSLSGSAWGKESALICQSEQPFHRASLHSAPVPEWELLISPGRLAYSRLVGSPTGEGQREGGSAGVRALVRAWQAADKSSSCCSCMHLPTVAAVQPLSLSFMRTQIHIAFLHTCEALIITLAFWWVSLLSSGKDKSKTRCLYWVWNH